MKVLVESSDSFGYSVSGFSVCGDVYDSDYVWSFGFDEDSESGVEDF